MCVEEGGGRVGGDMCVWLLCTIVPRGDCSKVGQWRQARQVAHLEERGGLVVVGGEDALGVARPMLVDMIHRLVDP